MKINKFNIKRSIIILILTLIIVIIASISSLLAISKFNPFPPKVMQREFLCSPDMCSSKTGVINIYENVKNKKQCTELGGEPIVYWSFAGKEVYQACGL